MMKETARVKEVMTKAPITLHPKNTIKEALEIFEKHDFHHLPITVSGKIAGIISLGDVFAKYGILQRQDQILSHLLKDSTVTYDYPIDTIMTRDVITIEEEQPLQTAANLILNQRINSVVVTDNDVCVGILTTHDIIKYYLHQKLA